MLFGGTDAPCVNGCLMSLSGLGPEENKVHAAAIFPVLTQRLGVAEDRIYLLFHQAATADLAWKGTTFQAILGK